MANWLWKNPIAIKDFRTRMRANRAFVIVTAHLVFLGLVVLTTFFLFNNSGISSTALSERRMFGKMAFGFVVVLELVMISFISPALTSGAISVEREHQTYDLVQVTLLPAWAIVFGKYLSALVFMFLLLFTALPFLSPALIFGGVLPEEIIIGILVLATTAIAFSAVGIFLSSLLKRTLIATVLSYAFSIFMVFGISLITLVGLVLVQSMFMNFNPDKLTQNTQIILIYLGWFLMSVTPLATIVGTEVILLEQQSPWLAYLEINSNLALSAPSPWIVYLILYMLLSLVLLGTSIHLISRVDR